nr:TMEM165/GDT1 family protein [Sulfobacillus harzensis]
MFASLYLAELPDKTSLATLALLRRHNPLWVWMGAGLALVAQTVIAVGAGRLLALVPRNLLNWIETLLFLAFAVWLWRSAGKPDEAPEDQTVKGRGSTVGRIFLFVFAAEFLDLTQMATIAFSAHHPQQSLAIGVMAAVALLSANATVIGFGRVILRYIPGSWIERGAALLFGAIGVAIGLGQLGVGL